MFLIFEEWMDENLVWNETFKKRSFIELNIEDVWKPAITLTNRSVMLRYVTTTLLPNTRDQRILSNAVFVF